MTHLSLFTGIGGLDLAAEMAGFETVGQCEFADYPTKVLEKHWPNVPRWRDIRTLTKESFYERTGLRTVTVISGGFPCQPFSVAGKRRGKADDRYLWEEMLRVIEDIKPTWVIGENVAGIVSMAEPDSNVRVESNTVNRYENEDYYEAVLSQQERMLLSGIIESLERIGYEVQPFIIPACAVDAPHRRDRIAIVAHTNSDTRNKRRPEPEGQQRPTGVADGGANVADASIEGKRRLSVQPGRSCKADQDADRSSQDVANAGRERLQGFQQRGAYIERSCRERSRTHGATGKCGDDVPNTVRHRWRTGSHKSHNDQERHNQAQKQARHSELCEIRPGRSSLPNATRQLRTRLELVSGGSAELANTDWWPAEPDVGRVAHGIPSRVDRLKCLGNAVVPPQFYPIFKAIAEIERGTQN